MNRKKFIIAGIVVAVLLAAAAGYWYYQYYQKTHNTAEINAIEQAGNAAEDLGQKASEGVLPSINPQSNPMENSPDTNPVSKTNPFSDIKTNPFK